MIIICLIPMLYLKIMFFHLKNQTLHSLSVLEIGLIFILLCILCRTCFCFCFFDWSYSIGSMIQKQPDIFVSNFASFLLWSWRISEYAPHTHTNMLFWHMNYFKLKVIEFPILNPSPTSYPISSLWIIPMHQPEASCGWFMLMYGKTNTVL